MELIKEMSNFSDFRKKGAKESFFKILPQVFELDNFKSILELIVQTKDSLNYHKVVGNFLLEEDKFKIEDLKDGKLISKDSSKSGIYIKKNELSYISEGYGLGYTDFFSNIENATKSGFMDFFSNQSFISGKDVEKHFSNLNIVKKIYYDRKNIKRTMFSLNPIFSKKDIDKHQYKNLISQYSGNQGAFIEEYKKLLERKKILGKIYDKIDVFFKFKLMSYFLNKNGKLIQQVEISNPKKYYENYEKIKEEIEKQKEGYLEIEKKLDKNINLKFKNFDRERHNINLKFEGKILGIPFGGSYSESFQREVDFQDLRQKSIKEIISGKIGELRKELENKKFFENKKFKHNVIVKKINNGIGKENIQKLLESEKYKNILKEIIKFKLKS